MKKLLGIIAIAVVASWNSSQSQNEVEMSDLALANVEALANPEGSEKSDRVITDEIKSMEVFNYGIKTTYYRHCSYGGSYYCVSGTWSDFTPRY